MGTSVTTSGLRLGLVDRRTEGGGQALSLPIHFEPYCPRHHYETKDSARFLGALRSRLQRRDDLKTEA